MIATQTIPISSSCLSSYVVETTLNTFSVCPVTWWKPLWIPSQFVQLRGGKPLWIPSQFVQLRGGNHFEYLLSLFSYVVETTLNTFSVCPVTWRKPLWIPSQFVQLRGGKPLWIPSWLHFLVSRRKLGDASLAHLMMYLWWNLCTLHLLACQVRVTEGDSGLSCCGWWVTSFERQLTPLCFDGKPQCYTTTEKFCPTSPA